MVNRYIYLSIILSQKAAISMDLQNNTAIV